jgi:hypothetical protein
MKERAPSILLLATADARGHLMRGQLLYHALCARGAKVSVLTTSDEGREFLSEFGVQAEVLSRHYTVLFDKRQKMRIWATDLRIATYFFLPWHMLRDIRRLSRRAAGVDLIVNDSFHPALLVMGGLSPWRSKTVHVYGWSLRESLERNFMGRMLGPWAHFFRWLVRLGLSRARGRLVHDFAFPLPECADCKLPEHQLPTPIALIAERQEKPSSRKAAVYLNPHFSDPALAEALETGLQEAISCSSNKDHGVLGNETAEDGIFFLGEGYAGRPGWHPYATNWIEIAARAELLVSAPGMAALAAAQALDKPILLIVTAQPEQQRNAARAAELGLRHRVVPWDESTTGGHFRRALREAYLELVLENKNYLNQRTGTVVPEVALKERLNVWANLLMDWSRSPKETCF